MRFFLTPYSIVLLILTGVCLQAGFTHLFAGPGKRPNPIVPLFGLLCLLGAAYAASGIWVLQAPDMAAYFKADNWHDGFLRVLTASLIWFLAYYADRRPGRFEAALSTAFLILGAFDIAPAQHGFFTHIDRFNRKPLPWGETVPNVSGPLSWVGYSIYAAYLALLGYGAWITWGLFRKRQKRKAWGLLAALLVSVVAFLNDFLVDANFYQGPFLVDYAYFTFLLLVGNDLGSRRIQAETNFQSLFDSVNDGIFVHDAATGQVLDVNETAAHMYGGNREEILRSMPEKMMQATAESTPAKSLELIQRTVREGPKTFEWPARTLAGLPFWVEVSLRAAVIDGRAVVLASVRDIQDRKRAQADLAESEARYRAIVDGFDGMIYICSPGKTLTFLNIPMQDYLGRNAVGEACQAVFGRSGSTDLWCGDQFSTVGSLHRESQDTQTGRWYDVSVSPIPHPDGTFSRLVLLRDITDRKRAREQRDQLEARIRQSEKLESLGVLAGGTAHDLNNLLTAIMGNADLALADVPEGSAPSLSLTRLKGAARRAAELAKQLLAYSGRGRFQRVPVPLNESVREVVDLLQATLPARVRIQESLDPQNPALTGDPTQVRQVILNLVTNAVESLGDKGGNVRVSTGRETVSPGSPGLLQQFFDGNDPTDQVVLEVADNGCGMEIETQRRMFEPFFSTKFAGRGLGMAAVLGIVRGHRGAIGLETQPGKGTALRIYLPGLAQKPKTGTPAPEKRKDPPQGRILVVDDEEMVREAVAGMLRTIGWKVDLAGDGSQALEWLRAPGSRPDLVLLDLTMPRLDGRQTAALIREIIPELPVILMSGAFARPEDDPEGLSGADAFLPKPFSVADLRQCLARFPIENK